MVAHTSTILCPRCSSNRFRGATSGPRRRYQCLACGRAFYTQEVLSTEYQLVLKLRSLAKEARSVIAK